MKSDRLGCKPISSNGLSLCDWYGLYVLFDRGDEFFRERQVFLLVAGDLCVEALDCFGGRVENQLFERRAFPAR